MTVSKIISTMTKYNNLQDGVYGDKYHLFKRPIESISEDDWEVEKNPVWDWSSFEYKVEEIKEKKRPKAKRFIAVIVKNERGHIYMSRLAHGSLEIGRKYKIEIYDHEQNELGDENEDF